MALGSFSGDIAGLELVMPIRPRLAAANAALVSFYFAPAWGIEALKALTSPYSGFEDRAHSLVPIYFRNLFDLGLDGLMRMSGIVAGVKLMIAAGFLAYLVEYLRALMVRREPDRATLDFVLVLALLAVVVLAWPALVMRDAALIRLYASQYLLLVGAGIVLTIERQIVGEEKEGAADKSVSPQGRFWLRPSDATRRSTKLCPSP